MTFASFFEEQLWDCVCEYSHCDVHNVYCGNREWLSKVKPDFNFAIIYKFMEMSLLEKYVFFKLKYLIIFIVNN